MESTSSSARAGRPTRRPTGRPVGGQSHADVRGLVSDRRRLPRSRDGRGTGVLVGIAGVCMMSVAAFPNIAGAVEAGAFAGSEVSAADSGGVVSGMWGDDEVYGGASGDVLLGGAGDDFIEAAGGERDVVRCGSGEDIVSADEGDTVLRDCETVFPSGS